MTDRPHVSAKHRRMLENLLREHLPGVEAWAYGSRVNRRSHDGSDLDLVLRSAGLKEIPIDQLANFHEALRESNIPFLVEAHDWARLPERFHREIEREYTVLIARSLRDKDFQQRHVQGPSRVGKWREGVYGRVRADYAERPLKSLCVSGHGIQTGPFGSQLHKKDYVSEGTPIVTVEHLGENRLIHRDLPQVSEQDRERLSKYRLQAGDIVFSRVGSVDRRALVRQAEEGWLFSGRCLRVRSDPNQIDPVFLSYFFGWNRFREHIKSIAVGATMPSLNTKLLSDIVVPHPPLHEQRAIAHILGTLDDKIELNRRMNETLEAMTRAIFQDWFVDFGPTRAKIEDRAPYLPPELWAMFPDALDEENKPVGWQKGILADVAESPRRGISPADVCENTPYIGLQHMPRRSIAISEWEGAGKVKSNKTQFNRGEILFGKLRPYFHKVGVAPLDGICSTDIVVVVPRAPEWRAFALACLSSDEFVNYTDRTSTGTKMPRTSWKTMAQYKMCLPSKQVVCAFQDIARPLLDNLGENVRSMSTLAETRNLLLPKLISGELQASASNLLTVTA